MRFFAVILFLLLTTSVRAGIHADTVTYWIVNYDKTTILRGNVNLKQPPRYELTVTGESLKNINVSFVYDAVQPKASSLVVKERNEILRTIEGDPDMGATFTVPVRELIGTHQPNVRYELDFYYSDDRGQKNLKLGTVIFIFK